MAHAAARWRLNSPDGSQEMRALPRRHPSLVTFTSFSQASVSFQGMNCFACGGQTHRAIHLNLSVQHPQTLSVLCYRAGTTRHSDNGWGRDINHDCGNSITENVPDFFELRAWRGICSFSSFQIICVYIVVKNISETLN